MLIMLCCSQSLASLHIDDLLQPEETDSCSKVLKKLHIDPQSKDGVLLSQAAENIKGIHCTYFFYVV